MNSDCYEKAKTRKFLAHRVKASLIQSLNLDLLPEEIADDAPLFGFGLGLDSIDALTLLVAIESDFNTNLPEDDPGVFRSVNTICDYLGNKFEPAGEHTGNSGIENRNFALDESSVAGYRAIRGGVGVTDFSEIGKILITGSKSFAVLDDLVAGNISSLPEGALCWTCLLHPDGKLIADVQIYRNFDDWFLTCASETKDLLLDYLKSMECSDFCVENLTERLAAIAIEGPSARDMPGDLFGLEAAGLPLLRFVNVDFLGADVKVSRFGLTGEYGYLLFVPIGRKLDLINKILAHPARPVIVEKSLHELLRLEVRAFDPHSHFLRSECLLEAGLHWMFDFRKLDFVGREAIMKKLNSGLSRKLVAFCADTPVSPGGIVFCEEDECGYVVSAQRSPALDKYIGLCYLNEELGCPGLHLQASSSNGVIQIYTVSTPFILSESTRISLE